MKKIIWSVLYLIDEYVNHRILDVWLGKFGIDLFSGYYCYWVMNFLPERWDLYDYMDKFIDKWWDKFDCTWAVDIDELEE